MPFLLKKLAVIVTLLIATASFAATAAKVTIINQSDATVYVNLDWGSTSFISGACLRQQQVTPHSSYLYTPIGDGSGCNQYVTGVNDIWYLGLSLDGNNSIPSTASGSLCSSTFNWTNPWALNKSIMTSVTILGNHETGYLCY